MAAYFASISILADLFVAGQDTLNLPHDSEFGFGLWPRMKAASGR